MNYNNELGGVVENDDDDNSFDFDLDATDDFFNTTDDAMDSEFTAIADHYIIENNNDNKNNELRTNNTTSINTNNADVSVNSENDNDYDNNDDKGHRHKFARVEEYSLPTESQRQLHSTTNALSTSSQDHSQESYTTSINNNNVNYNNRTVTTAVEDEVNDDMDVEATFNTHDHEFHHDAFGNHDDMDFHDLHHDDVYSSQSNPAYFNGNNNINNNTGSNPPLKQQSNNNNMMMMSENEYENEMECPPFIENVQSYLPSVAPDAFPVIVAVLAQANINAQIDLCELSCATRNVEFVPTRRAASATMRLHEPSAVILIRSSGAMSIIGSASISEARQAAELAARIIRKALNLTYDTFQFRVRSLMARFNVCSPVRLEALARYRMTEEDAIPGVGGVFGSYEPERFSGCILRIVGNAHRNRWSVSCTVFVTGKVTMLGARSEYELRFAFDALVPILAKFAVPLRDEVHNE